MTRNKGRVTSILSPHAIIDLIMSIVYAFPKSDITNAMQ